MNSTCKIAILESFALFSSGIKSLLHTSDEMEVIAEGISPETLLLQLHNQTPDIILIDLLHCFNAGLKTVKKTRKLFPHVPFLLITNTDFSECFTDYRSLGAKGFIYTHDSPEVLIDSIKSLCNGKMYFKNGNQTENSLADHLMKNHFLSDREVDVLKLFCNGLTYKEIGKKLYISPRTVESHKKNILAKLNVSSTAEMIKYATRNSLISD